MGMSITVPDGYELVETGSDEYTAVMAAIDAMCIQLQWVPDLLGGSDAHVVEGQWIGYSDGYNYFHLPSCSVYKKRAPKA